MALRDYDELTASSFRTILQHADHMTHCQLRFGVGVAARVQEIENLCWPDVDLTGGRVWLANSPASACGRFVVLPPNVLAMLWDMKVWTKGDPSGSVWADEKGICKVPLRTCWRRLFAAWAKAHSQGKVTDPPPATPPPASQMRRLSFRLLLDRGLRAEAIALWSGAPEDTVERARG